MNRRISWVLIFVLIEMLFFPMDCNIVHATEKTSLHYMALGDSIPNGYFDKGYEGLTGYPVLLKSALEKQAGYSVQYTGNTVDGLTTKRMNQDILSDPKVKENLKSAHLITVTVGANDLLNQLKSISKKALGREENFVNIQDMAKELKQGIDSNPLLVLTLTKEVMSWDYSKYETRWVQAMDTINENRNAQSQLIVTNLYNPLNTPVVPDSLKQIIDEVIQKNNEMLLKYKDTYHYKIADIYATDIKNHVQKDGIHPDAEGQEIIARSIWQKIKLKNKKRYDSHSTQKAELISCETHRNQRITRIFWMAIGSSVMLILLLLILRGNRRQHGQRERKREEK